MGELRPKSSRAKEQPMPVYMIGYDLHPSEGRNMAGHYGQDANADMGCAQTLSKRRRPAPCYALWRRSSWHGFKDDCQAWLEDNLKERRREMPEPSVPTPRRFTVRRLKRMTSPISSSCVNHEPLFAKA